MRNLRMLDILKRIGTGIILSLFVVSAYEDSFAFSFQRYFSETSRQSAVSETAPASKYSGKTNSYDACGKQHSGHLPCENSCQFTGCLDAVLVQWNGVNWKKHSIKPPFVGIIPPFRPSVPELARGSNLRHTFSDIPDKNSYTSLVGIIKNLN